MTDNSDLGSRMKKYENISRIYLTQRMPAIIRCDGCHFSTYTRGFSKPWNLEIRDCMTEAAKGLMDKIQGAQIAYVQSDEISVLLIDYKHFDSQAWFDKNVQKMSSVSASICAGYFNKKMRECSEKDDLNDDYREFLKKVVSNRIATFDGRCWSQPREDVVNYYYWRQRDAVRNSISGYAQANFSHKQLFKKNSKDMKEMLKEKGIIWEDLNTWQKFGWCVIRYPEENNRTVLRADYEIPDFNEDRDYIGKYLEQVEE